ncbi:tRNA (adenosine(37)-N6)-dimethylallyltransferase MiaA [Acetobacter papayae]|uniref:tRNA (adenosine(37)-N6)-dimethylallyltransferase MiaA n=1 Tax=Acetobacter papayae TaxID=1076592 RepID=UPI0039E913BC
MKQAEHPMTLSEIRPSGPMAQGAPVALVVAGPTCSGKSALALSVARALAEHGREGKGWAGATIINADSMQVYKDLRVLTARPSVAEEQAVPHRLYGVLPASSTGSVAWWRTHALEAMQEAWGAGRLPVLCGGTGMYFRALTHGLAAIPECPQAVRDEARQAMAQDGAPALHARLASVDPETAARLQPADSQRITRAWEVWRATGRSLSWWQAQPGLPPAACRFVAVRLAPERTVLRARIQARFEAMLAAGAVDEVCALLAQGLDPALPAMRAHGVPELAAMLEGRITQDEAMRLAVQATGRYTKRQATWFGHHALAEPDCTCNVDTCFENVAQFSERKLHEIISFILRSA